LRLEKFGEIAGVCLGLWSGDQNARPALDVQGSKRLRSQDILQRLATPTPAAQLGYTVLMKCRVCVLHMLSDPAKFMLG
jgi:hypothetical protein